MTYYIWWLNQRDCESLGENPPLKGYLLEEFRSREGRAGRGRLWVSTEFPEFPSFVQYSPEAEKRLAVLGAGDYGGIVIRPEDLDFCQGTPGLVTDPQANRV
jgi:hypothetical protein